MHKYNTHRGKPRFLLPKGRYGGNLIKSSKMGGARNKEFSENLFLQRNLALFRRIQNLKTYNISVLKKKKSVTLYVDEKMKYFLYPTWQARL